MRLLISDTNILIDMEAGALMETLFHNDYLALALVKQETCTLLTPSPSGHQSELVSLVMIPNIDWNDFILSNDEFKGNLYGWSVQCSRVVMPFMLAMSSAPHGRLAVNSLLRIIFIFWPKVIDEHLTV